MATKPQLIKDFFSVPGKPVTNQELLDFAKSDNKGYQEIAALVAKATGQTIE